MLRYSDTTVFNVHAQVIVNTVNCVGVMGNGLALECRLRYPAMFADYAERCRRGEVRIGRPYLYWETPDFGVLNFPCKDHWRFPAKVEWIRRGLAGFLALLAEQPLSSVAFPPLGCDLGRLRWDDIKPVMEDVLGDLPIDITICLDREPAATGIDGQMTALLNDADHPFWLSSLAFPRRTRERLRAALPIAHFRDLRHAADIGSTTYERVHRYLYAQVTR